MKRTMILVALSAVLALNAVTLAGPGGPPGAALQDVLDGITVGGPSSVNVATDFVPDGSDDQWHITATGGMISTMIIEIADFAGTNVFGIYDLADPAKRLVIFDGAAGSKLSDPPGVGAQATLSSLADGTFIVTTNWPLGGAQTSATFSSTWFGFYLDATAGNNDPDAVFFSDTTLNDDKLDHFYAYQGKGDPTQILPFSPGTWTVNEYVLAFEDLLVNPDWDFTDMVVMVESVEVPVPGAVLLGVLGLSVAGARLRKRS
ncbi:MAG TPA: DUF4114 domain-containing protein [Sedimentisphaerales bacterium]|nr:DUF4114 domain-containing protein [Planctomycetaceae bacterium]HOC61558.1 DUF4114 domain-containing protein [Sedimentisphaerales bacterium]HQN31829.1 DUF4114 domain-containing protein [Sedimentisphaerales bacterium]